MKSLALVPHESAADGLRHLPPDLPVVAVDAGEDIPVPVVTVGQRAGAGRVDRR